MFSHEIVFFSDVPPNQQGMDPRNFNMYRQPPPNIPPQGGPFASQQHQNQFPYQEPPAMQPPPHFGQNANNMSVPLQEDNYESGETDNRNEESHADPADIEEEQEIAREEESAKKQIEESSSNLKQQYDVSHSDVKSSSVMFLVIESTFLSLKVGTVNRSMKTTIIGFNLL